MTDQAMTTKEQSNMAETKPRYHLLDSIRGLLLIMMIVFHTMFDVMIMGDGSFSVRNIPGYVFQQSIGYGFIFLSGMCRAIGKRHLRRGLTVLGAAALVSFVTYVFTPGQAINFGVLVLLGSSMLIVIPLEKVIKDKHAPIGLGLSLVLFILTRNVSDGNLGFEGLKLIELPDFLYRNFATAYLGFPPADFASGDYYPLIPWFFLYMCGYFFWKLIGTKEWVKKPLLIKIPVLSFLGRHSLLVYLLHQPICYAAVYFFCVIL